MEESYLFELAKREQNLNIALSRIRNYILKREGKILYESDTYVFYYGSNFNVWVSKINREGYILVGIDSLNPLVEKVIVSKIEALVNI